VAAALNLGLPLPLHQQQQQQLKSVPLRLGGCVHSHHCGENSALWPTITQVVAGSSGASHLGGAAGFGAAADDKSCYRFGPTRFSVIPKVAVGKLSLRFVPEQEHSTLIECLQVHLEKKFEQLWSANKMELQVRGLAMFFAVV
jgi:acetylornithine deacetylase/succinyl-diaminopimelate desuccinylase-like protein